jgi:AcrR family transcriptional regulator
MTHATPGAATATATVTPGRPPARSGPDRNERRKARTRTALIAAARRLFGDRGFEATTVAEIAEQADIAIGSFYNYFRTKEDLLAALLKETRAEQLRSMETRRTGIGDPAEAISVAHRHFVRLAWEEPEWAWLFVRLDVPHRVANAVLGSSAMRDLKEGISTGRFHVASRQVALQASGGALIAVMHALLLGELGEHTDSEHAEGVLRSFGLDPLEAAEIARRPLPEATRPTNHGAGA